MSIADVVEATKAFAQTQEDIRKKRDQYWAMLRRARNDFIKLTEQACVEYELGEGAFYYFLQQNYGLKIELIDGKISSNYEITDEKKYTIFLLRYGS